MLKSVPIVGLNLNNKPNKTSGWNWLSFILGPLWYLSNGLIGKGFFLLIISIITLGFGIPIIWLYCGLRANSDLYEKKMRDKSRIDLNKL